MAPTVSYQMSNSLRAFFEEKNYGRTVHVGDSNNEVRFNNHNFNPVFLRISSNQDGSKFEVPSLIRDALVRDSICNHTVGEYAIPLTVISTQSRRTADSMLKYFFDRSRRNYYYVLGLKKAVTSKGEVYYGAPGLILNGNFEPLIIGITEYNRGEISGNFERHVLKISPSVFVSEGFLEKAIIKKLIPFYTGNTIDQKTVKVEVDNISKYIVKPNAPKYDVQKNLKEILHTYQDEILDNLL